MAAAHVSRLIGQGQPVTDGTGQGEPVKVKVKANQPPEKVGGMEFSCKKSVNDIVKHASQTSSHGPYIRHQTIQT
jgi:hypothetical protein